MISVITTPSLIHVAGYCVYQGSRGVLELGANTLSVPGIDCGDPDSTAEFPLNRSDLFHRRLIWLRFTDCPGRRGKNQ